MNREAKALMDSDLEILGEVVRRFDDDFLNKARAERAIKRVKQIYGLVALDDEDIFREFYEA